MKSDALCEAVSRLTIEANRSAKAFRSIRTTKQSTSPDAHHPTTPHHTTPHDAKRERCQCVMSTMWVMRHVHSEFRADFIKVFAVIIQIDHCRIRQHN